jgi:hypothetical protein
MEVNLYDCPHCKGTGTCTVDNNCSCFTCLKDAKADKESRLVICSVCEGSGKIESKSERLRNRTPFFIVAIVLIIFYLYTLSHATDREMFEKIFPVVASLTTMIVTFYFSKR